MAQQQGGSWPPDANQSIPGGQSGGPSYRYVTNNTQKDTLTPEQRRVRLERKRELARRKKQRRNRRVAIALILLALLVAVFMLVYYLHGVSDIDIETELDEVDAGDLDDEAEEALYDGPPVATIAFVGDISASADQVADGTKADGTYDFAPVYEDIAEYFKKDRIAYAVGDFESTIVDNISYGGAPYYNAPVEFAGALRNLGIRLVSTANTHALDNGIEGIRSTKNYLTQLKLRSVGTYLSQEERDENGGAYIRNIHKIKFAFLSYTKGTDSVTMPEGCEYALSTLYTDYADYWSNLDSDRIAQDVQAAKEAGAEVIVALIHWGSEYSRSVSAPQEEVMNLLLQNGVDVIIGTHSHLVSKMGFEKVTMSDGSVKQCFVAYGLGDFCTDPEQATAQQSMILNLEFSRGDDGRVTITDVNYVPIYNYITQEGGKRTFRLLDVYRNLAELKRVDMTSAQAELFNQLLDTIDTMHNYGGEELDVGPKEADRRIVEKAIEEGEVSSATIRALKKAEEDEAEAAQRAEREAQEAQKAAEQEAAWRAEQEAAQQTAEEPEE